MKNEFFWSDINAWKGSDTLSYNEANNALCFNSDGEAETAIYTFTVPDNASNFKFSIEIGNSQSISIKTLDTAYLWLEFYDDSNTILNSIYTMPINENTHFVKYSLGHDKTALSIPQNAASGAIIIKAAGNNKAPIQAYFRNGELSFNHQAETISLENYVTFDRALTDDLLRIDGSRILYGYIAFALLLATIIVGTFVVKPRYNKWKYKQSDKVEK